jgi:alkaline phosphatase D
MQCACHRVVGSVALSDYRDRYALHRSEKSLQAMHAQCPWLITWDDHEVSNDYAGLESEAMSGNIGFDFVAQRARAYQAFYEHMPLRASALTQVH